MVVLQMITRDKHPLRLIVLALCRGRGELIDVTPENLNMSKHYVIMENYVIMEKKILI